jgi:hypothetical protein
MQGIGHFLDAPVTLRVPPGPRPHGKRLQCLQMTLRTLLVSVWKPATLGSQRSRKRIPESLLRLSGAFQPRRSPKFAYTG